MVRSSQVLRLLLVALSTVPEAVVAAQPIDLSQPWTEGTLYNRNKAYCTIQQNLNRNTRGYVVVENGEIVAEAYTKGNDLDGQYRSFSSTKSWSTMLIGTIVQSGLLSTNETLNDIFTEDSDWYGVKQAEEKKRVTVEELLTMTSGLVENYSTLKWLFTQRNIPQDNFQQVMNSMTYKPSKRGTWQYLGLIHILAQIIVRRSSRITPGFTPREVARPIFAEMGISDLDYDWTTFNGVEGTAYGIQANPRILAKLGQLYLQNGVSAPGKQLVPSEWVAMSTMDQLDDGEENWLGLLYGGTTGYGYQWYNYKDGGTGKREGMSLALGAYGQVIAFLPSRNVTIAIMSNECRYGDLVAGVLLNTIIENLDDLGVEQTQCEKRVFSFSRLYYLAKYSIDVLPPSLKYFFSIISQ